MPETRWRHTRRRRRWGQPLRVLRRGIAAQPFRVPRCRSRPRRRHRHPRNLWLPGFPSAGCSSARSAGPCRTEIPAPGRRPRTPRRRRNDGRRQGNWAPRRPHGRVATIPSPRTASCPVDRSRSCDTDSARFSRARRRPVAVPPPGPGAAMRYRRRSRFRCRHVAPRAPRSARWPPCRQSPTRRCGRRK